MNMEYDDNLQDIAVYLRLGSYRLRLAYKVNNYF